MNECIELISLLRLRLLSVRRVLAPAWFLVLRLHADPDWGPVLPLERRLVVEAEPGHGLQLARGKRGRALAVTGEPAGLLCLPGPCRPQHPPVTFEVRSGSGNLHTGGLPPGRGAGAGGTAGQVGLLEEMAGGALTGTVRTVGKGARRGGLRRHRGHGGRGGGQRGQPPRQRNRPLTPPTGLALRPAPSLPSLLSAACQGGGFGSSRLWQRL